LRQHELYLQPFNDVFKYVDSDKDGILSLEEFRDLMKMLEFREKSDQPKAGKCCVLND